jgi:hypothetical protein
MLHANNHTPRFYYSFFVRELSATTPAIHTCIRPNLVLAAISQTRHVQKRKVDPDEAKQYAEENNIMFMETSAKTAANVNELFVQIGELFVSQ